MKKFDRYKKNITNFLYDHYLLKRVLEEVKGVFFAILSAFIFSFGFSAFIIPLDGMSTLHIATGGVSGLSQILALLVQMFGGNLTSSQLTAIGYVMFNIPILIFGFFFVGKRFAIQTAVNVGFSSLFLFLIPEINNGEFLRQLLLVGSNGTAPYVGAIGTSTLARAVFSGAIIGLSSAIAFKFELSCGGIDVITYYLSNKKSSSVGKFALLVNSIIIGTYAILLAIYNGGDWAYAIGSLLYCSVYLIMSNVVVDMINLRNKKLKIEIISNVEHMGEILIANFPHGATKYSAKGVYSGTDKNIFIIVVSSNEVNKVVKLARKVDEHSFISVTSLVQVYGNFFIKPIN